MELFRPDPTLLSAPAELLALEEALLEFCEASDHPGFLSFWESQKYFVVLGYAKQLAQEVFESECDTLEIPILRRCSGGGTVLQGPDCLNYTLVLPINYAPELDTITGANRFIMEKVRAALAPLASSEVQVRGHTDLTLDRETSDAHVAQASQPAVSQVFNLLAPRRNEKRLAGPASADWKSALRQVGKPALHAVGLKFSGNAQRRKRRCLLFHGSFLLNFDLALIAKTLRLPPQQPDYRENRAHQNFLTNCQLDPAKIQLALVQTWNATAPVDVAIGTQVHAAAQCLAASKYSRDDWNRRF